MIQGSGLTWVVHGEDKKKVHGFFVNRTVEAQNLEEAKAIALGQVRIEAAKKYGEGAVALVLEVEEIESPESSMSPQGFILFGESSKAEPWWKFWG